MRIKQSVAIYLRLSIEDAAGQPKGRKEQEESNSISNQRKLLKEYIGSRPELADLEIVEFCDDGFSGTSMDRPGMQELLKQVKQGKISCILVKDMSRFSRDYIELGNYLNQIFPFLGVRFISVNDHYDNREHEGTTIELDTAFQTLLYDLYSKDVSVKVKAALQSKCENGEYVFGQMPLGYEKSKSEKNAVVVNEKEAEIVRYIFSLAEKGMSSTQIAKKLYEEKVPTATQLRFPERKQVKENHTWSGTIVRSILNNRFYLGEMVYGKSVRKFVGSKARNAIPKEEWKVIPCHHEPLVSPEVFALVSAFRPEQSTKRKREKHPLTGKIYCGGCGYSINYKPQRDNNKMLSHFWCRKHSLLQIPDCCTYFRADILEEIILIELYRELMRRGDCIKQQESLERFQKEEVSRLNRGLSDYRLEYQSMQREKDLLYENYASKQMEAGEYRRRADEIDLYMQEISERIREAELKYSRTEEEYCRPKQDMEDIIRFSKMEKLTQEMVDVFIKKVTIYRDKRVEIEWNYAFGEE